MMKRIKTLLLGMTVMAGTLLPLADANAWVAAAGGWRGGVAVRGGFGGYHPYNHPSGCYGCGAAVGAVAGLAVGAAIGNASPPPPVYVQQPGAVYIAPPPVYVSQPYLPLGTQVATVPYGSRNMQVNGQTFYQSGSVWYKPYYGSSGVYYEVVPTP